VTWDIDNSVPLFLSTTRRASGIFGLQGVGLSERHSGEISRAKLKMRDFRILRGHKLGCVFSMPSQKASAPWGYIRDLRALAIISFRPYGDGSFLRSPSCWLQPCCSSISSGMPGTCSQLCIPAYFPRRGFYLARDSFWSSIRSD
jgi:hypothetical protein